ncbi:MAG: UDP-N-acetylmuramate dehydrogenase [Oscillospiraceae bacterium]|nr:UDP-N-acetylmuramate dehydrogenase [Oscillospiraceae bacterium]
MSDFSTFQRNNPDFPGEICIRYGEPMSKHTSFRIGGNVEAMAFPKNREELSLLLNWSGLLDRKPVILGAGTNVLAPDEGMEGLIICLKDCLDGMERLDDRRIRVMAGVTLSRAAMFAASQGLSGLEFAHGIPGTLGGGVYMNAGAYGGDLESVCREVELMDFRGNLYTRTGEEMDFSYRHSCLESEPAIVVSAVLELEPGKEEDIRGRMKALQTKRLASQPLNLPSAGSAFKRPAGGYAAALIEQAGLKGFRVGDAAISEKHAGFAVNLGGATAADVKKLLEEVSRRVEAHSGIRLEPEIRIW